MAIMAIGFSACNDNDGYSIGDIGISWATVHTLDDGKTFYLDSDNYGSLWLGGSRVPNFTPKNGERVVAVFNPLYDNYQGYDMAILLERLYPVLTKDVLFSTTKGLTFTFTHRRYKKKMFFSIFIFLHNWVKML